VILTTEAELEERIETPPAPSREPQPAPVLEPPPRAPVAEHERPPVPPKASLEDLLAGRLFAWVSPAMCSLRRSSSSRPYVGLIDRPTRIALAFAGSASHVVAGVLL
jgi:hypothetical protein